MGLISRLGLANTVLKSVKYRKNSGYFFSMALSFSNESFPPFALVYGKITLAFGSNERNEIRFGYILLNLVCPLIGSDKIIVFFVRPRRRKNIDFVCARLNTIKDTVISDNV